MKSKEWLLKLLRLEGSHLFISLMIFEMEGLEKPHTKVAFKNVLVFLQVLE